MEIGNGHDSVKQLISKSLECSDNVERLKLLKELAVELDDHLKMEEENMIHLLIENFTKRELWVLDSFIVVSLIICSTLYTVRVYQSIVYFTLYCTESLLPYNIPINSVTFSFVYCFSSSYLITITSLLHGSSHYIFGISTTITKRGTCVQHTMFRS